MKFVLIFIMCSLSIACVSVRECEQDADMMGIDRGLCNTIENRENIGAQYRIWSVEQIDGPDVSKDADYSQEINNLDGKISELQKELLQCREIKRRLTVPEDVRQECNCETWSK